MTGGWGLLCVDTQEQTPFPLGIPDAKDALWIHGKFMRMVKKLATGFPLTNKFKNNVSAFFNIFLTRTKRVCCPMVHCKKVQLLYLLNLVLAVNVFLKRANRIIPQMALRLKREVSFK